MLEHSYTGETEEKAYDMEHQKLIIDESVWGRVEEETKKANEKHT